MFSAKVISGKGRGKGLGFPTLNLEIPENFNIKEGIYASKIWLYENEYIGALHFGPIPVFNDSRVSLEIFVLDWDGKNPPKNIVFDLGEYIRPIQNFVTPEALTAQIAKDVSNIRSS